MSQQQPATQEWPHSQCRQCNILKQRVDSLQQENRRLRLALTDQLAGWSTQPSQPSDPEILCGQADLSECAWPHEWSLDTCPAICQCFWSLHKQCPEVKTTDIDFGVRSRAKKLAEKRGLPTLVDVFRELETIVWKQQKASSTNIIMRRLGRRF